MIESKHIGKIVVALLALAVAALLCIGIFADTSSPVEMAYESSLFDTSEIMKVDIKIDSDDWEELLANATSEEYYTCDITINDSTCYNVGIRAKGNTSLSSVVSSGSDRFSFKVQFDEYISGQTYEGLDKLVLNNNFADATMMKEALTYDMFAFLGADASLYNYAEVSVNGEYWGVYLALEPVEESMLMRNYGVGYGEIYKPDNLNFGGAGNMRSVDIDDIRDALGFGGENGTYSNFYNFWNKTRNNGESETGYGTTDGTDTTRQNPGGMEMPGYGITGGQIGYSMTDFGGYYGNFYGGNMRGNAGGNMGGFGGSRESGGDTSLNYIDDELDNYSDIWNASIFDTTDADHRRVVTALKNISEGTDLEKYMDVDNVLRYMAVQTFVVNLDSLTGTMEHNYYLYEEDGQLNILPWDYNLSFGGFSGTASSVVNFAIDTPFTGDTANRQFFMSLLENDEYLTLYHKYLSQLVDEYVNGGGFVSFYNRVRGQINNLVETDPTSFYTYDEYDTAAQMLYDTVLLRAQSISGQLDGTIPSTTEGQEADSSALIDATSINLETMGVMNTAMKTNQNSQTDRRSWGNMPTNNYSSAEKNTGTGDGQISTTSPTSSTQTKQTAEKETQAIPGGGQNGQSRPSGNNTGNAPTGEAPTGEAPTGAPAGETTATAETAIDTTASETSSETASAAETTESDGTQSTAPETGNGENAQGMPGNGESFSRYGFSQNDGYSNTPGTLSSTDSKSTDSSSLLTNTSGVIMLAICFALMLISVFLAAIYKRR